MSRLTSSFVLFTFLMAASSTMAVNVAIEDFNDKTAGTLDGQGGGTGWTGNWTAGAAYQTVISGANLSYAFSGGQTISGGDKALELSSPDTGDHGDVAHRQLASTVSDEKLYFSFLLKRTGGSSTSGLDFAMLWLDDDLGSGSTAHSDFPNIGVYEPGPGGNHIMARTQYPGANTQWAVAGGSSNTTSTELIVGRLTKGNNATYQGDYDRWDIWAFDSASPGSVLDFRTPHDSTNAPGGDMGAFDYIGARIVQFEADDKIVYDELRVGTQLTDAVPTIVGITLDEVQQAKVLDFESAPNGPISSTDPLFRDFGIIEVSATGGSASGDVQNQNGQTGKALFYNGSQFLILPQDSDPFDNSAWPFGDNQTFRLDFAAHYNQFGLSFQDQTNQDFTFTFYQSGVEMGSIVEYSGSTVNDMFIYETPFFFNRVTIDGAVSTDGFGIDNIVLGIGVPEPATVVLMGLGGLALLGLVRRRRS